MKIPRGSFDAYAALVFDCDGTLVDTMPTHYLAWRQTLESHGIGFEVDRFYRLGGVPAPRIAAMLAEEAGVDVDATVLAAQKEDRFIAALTTAEPIAAVVEIARRYRDRKPIAVATGSPRAIAHHALDLVGIRDWFDAIITYEDVAHPKPAPDTYLEAAKRLGVEPADCLVFEDGEPGLESARAAGMDVIDVRPLHATTP